MTEGLTDQPGLLTIVIGSATAILGAVLGRKSRPLDKADTVARIGDAWDRIAVQLTQDNTTLRGEIAELKKAERHCQEQLDRLERLSHANEMRHDHLVDYLNDLGLKVPADSMSDALTEDEVPD